MTNRADIAEALLDSLDRQTRHRTPVRHLRHGPILGVMAYGRLTG